MGTSIVAGCGFATTLLKVVLLDALDVVTSGFPEVAAYAYVDDIDLAAVGKPAEVAN